MDEEASLVPTVRGTSAGRVRDEPALPHGRVPDAGLGEGMCRARNIDMLAPPPTINVCPVSRSMSETSNDLLVEVSQGQAESGGQESTWSSIPPVTACTHATDNSMPVTSPYPSQEERSCRYS
jgi:hypothetical protein